MPKKPLLHQLNVSRKELGLTACKVILFANGMKKLLSQTNSRMKSLQRQIDGPKKITAHIVSPCNHVFIVDKNTGVLTVGEKLCGLSLANSTVNDFASFAYAY